MSYKKMVRGLLAAALLTFLSTEVRAGLIIGDFVSGGNIFSGYEVGPGGGLNNAIAEGFTMTQSASLASVSVNLSDYLFRRWLWQLCPLAIYSGQRRQQDWACRAPTYTTYRPT